MESYRRTSIERNEINLNNLQKTVFFYHLIVENNKLEIMSKNKIKKKGSIDVNKFSELQIAGIFHNIYIFF